MDLLTLKIEKWGKWKDVISKEENSKESAIKFTLVDEFLIDLNEIKEDL